jgi:branched-chain amino acid aminotransferase
VTEPLDVDASAKRDGAALTAVALPAVWVNGELQESAGPHLSAFDRGLTLSDGVFETMRVHRGRVFRLDRHLARLNHALAVLNIPRRPELRDWVVAALSGLASSEASLRLTVTRGVGPGGVAPPTDPRPTVIMAVSSLPVFPSSIYDHGLKCHVASGRRNERAMTSGLKTLAFTDAVAALLEAQQAGADEALFLDTEGHCSEATSSNLFVWRRSTLLTPPVSCGALPGITRAAVLELATGLGVPCAERIVGPDELISSAEAFLTSSLRGLVPLVQVGPQRLGSGAPGVLTRRLADAYTALVDRECTQKSHG